MKSSRADDERTRRACRELRMTHARSAPIAREHEQDTISASAPANPVEGAPVRKREHADRACEVEDATSVVTDEPSPHARSPVTIPTRNARNVSWIITAAVLVEVRPDVAAYVRVVGTATHFLSGVTVLMKKHPTDASWTSMADIRKRPRAHGPNGQDGCGECCPSCIFCMASANSGDITVERDRSTPSGRSLIQREQGTSGSLRLSPRNIENAIDRSFESPARQLEDWSRHGARPVGESTVKFCCRIPRRASPCPRVAFPRNGPHAGALMHDVGDLVVSFGGMRACRDFKLLSNLRCRGDRLRRFCE